MAGDVKDRDGRGGSRGECACVYMYWSTVPGHGSGWDNTSAGRSHTVHDPEHHRLHLIHSASARMLPSAAVAAKRSVRTAPESPAAAPLVTHCCIRDSTRGSAR